ncbi:hypothetical protein JVU11DRAFT_4262 [Chiua virens]|nr:hypothetical protein JVU11DRAFT_4262 [Chiua virens]
MAAFLHEIKTAKLRKVDSGLNAMGGDGVAGPSGLSKSVIVHNSFASTNPGKLTAKELLRRRSLASLRVPIGSALAAPVPFSLLAASESDGRVGRKRKAHALGEDEETSAPAPAKRRLAQSSSQPSGSSQSSAASSSESPLLSNLSAPPRPLSTNETDVTTPSLSSDNDREENSIEDRVPSTPPGSRVIGCNSEGFHDRGSRRAGRSH